MALRAIKDFPKATPSTEDLILIEQQGGGRSVSLKELPVSTPVEKKISDVQKDLNARITALAFEPGDTTGDAELRDIRNPADGFTVPAETNAGGAVRAQVTQLDDKISNLKGDIGDLNERLVMHDPESNFIDVSKNKTGGYINGSNGEVISNTGFAYTDFIELDANTPYFYGNIYGGYYAFYDENKIFVAGEDSLSSLTQGFKIPENAKYGRFTINLSWSNIDSTWIFTRNENPKPYSELLKLSSIPNDNSVSSDKIKSSAVTVDKIDFKKHDESTNFINSWKDNCYIGADGSEIAYNGFGCSEYIILSPNKNYYYGGGVYNGYYAYYREDGSLIEGHGNDASLSNPFITPDETYYMRVTITYLSYKDTAWINPINMKPKPYTYVIDTEKIKIKTDYIEDPCEYLGDEICAFTKCICIGDSLTEGVMNHLDSGATEYTSYDKYSFPRNLERLTNLEVTNKGHSGLSSSEWYSAESSVELRGYDIAIIQLGVNDQIRYGEFGDTSKTAFTNIINKLKTENKNIKIFVANIIPAMSYSSDGMKKFSADLLEWLKITYANDEDVIPLDIQKYGHTKSADAYNCGHLSAYGYYRLAKDYKAYISYYMNQNPNVFKEIQFIGTDYWYDDPNS